MAKTSLGGFLWHELITTDPSAALTFYTEVIGWKTAPWGSDGRYTLLLTESGLPVGGCGSLSPEAAAQGTRPHWLCSVGTPNVDATAAKAKQLGGAVIRGPIDIPGTGRYAVLNDPFGAAFCLYTPTTPADSPAIEPIGGFSWHELVTSSPEAALKFYGSLFGWEKDGEFDMGPAGMYELFAHQGRQVGGVYPQADTVPEPNWLPYARVASVDRAAELTAAKGGKVMVPPMEVPGGGWISMLSDPQGGNFAVHQAPA